MSQKKINQIYGDLSAATHRKVVFIHFHFVEFMLKCAVLKYLSFLCFTSNFLMKLVHIQECLHLHVICNFLVQNIFNYGDTVPELWYTLL